MLKPGRNFIIVLWLAILTPLNAYNLGLVFYPGNNLFYLDRYNFGYKTGFKLGADLKCDQVLQSLFLFGQKRYKGTKPECVDCFLPDRQDVKQSFFEGSIAAQKFFRVNKVLGLKYGFLAGSTISTGQEEYIDVYNGKDEPQGDGDYPDFILLHLAMGAAVHYQINQLAGSLNWQVNLPYYPFFREPDQYGKYVVMDLGCEFYYASRLPAKPQDKAASGPGLLSKATFIKGGLAASSIVAYIIACYLNKKTDESYTSYLESLDLDVAEERQTWENYYRLRNMATTTTFVLLTGSIVSLTFY